VLPSEHLEGKVCRVLYSFLITIDAKQRTDSTVLAYVMKTLNERYQYGLNLFLLSIDEGITGYRDDSLEVSTNGLFFLSTTFYSTLIMS
jgi:hypothetical protein